MSKFLHYEQCPRCLEKGRDNRADNLSVWSDGGKHCFACNYHVFPKHYIKPEKEEVNDPKVLPSDFSREIPGKAWEWLLQYGLPYSYWKPFVGWSEKDSRLVITVGTGPEFSIGRYIPTSVAISSKEPRKYSQSEPRKWYVWGNSHKTPHIFGTYQESKEIVLVEDVISAHKIGFSQAPKPLVDHTATGISRCCIPLFGTRVFDAVVPVLRHIGLPIMLWLDKDQEHTMPKKCGRLAMLTGLPVRFVVTEADPKCLSFEKIKEVLDDSST